MHYFRQSAFCLTVLLASIVNSDVNAEEWDYEASIYLFTAETDTSIGPATATLSFSDALENLDMAFMGAFSANNGTFGILIDYMFTDLSFSNATPGPAFSGLNASVNTKILNAYATYRVYDRGIAQLDLAGGFRWFDTSTTLTFSPGALPGSTSVAGDDWFDPVLGVRGRYQLSDRWATTAFLDYGGFSSSSESWQVLLTADYALNDNWSLRGGYRYLSVEHSLNGSDYEFSQSGPMFGTTFRF